MLKVIHFNGYIVADLDVSDAPWRLKGIVKDSLEDDDSNIHCTSKLITLPSDIPKEWLNGTPYNREDDKTCIQIYKEEILPNQPVNDPNQDKFGFIENIKPEMPK